MTSKYQIVEKLPAQYGSINTDGALVPTFSSGN